MDSAKEFHVRAESKRTLSKISANVKLLLAEAV